MPPTVPINRETDLFTNSTSSEIFRTVKLEDFKNYVLKTPKSSVERDETMSDEEYYKARLQWALSTASSIKERQSTVEECVQIHAPTVLVPPHFVFVCNGVDQFPTYYLVQELVEGKILSEYGLNNLSDQQLRSLRDLLNADQVFYNKYGYHMDLGGSTPKAKFLDKGKKLISGFIKNSSNIMVAADKNICLIDSDPHEGTSIARDIVIRSDGFRIRKLINKLNSK